MAESNLIRKVGERPALKGGAKGCMQVNKLGGDGHCGIRESRCTVGDGDRR